MNYRATSTVLNSTDKYYLSIYDTENPSNNWTDFNLEYLDIDYPETDKFQTIRKSICNITINIQLSGITNPYEIFFTPNIFKWNVVILKNTELFYEGYLNTESYTEDYSNKIFSFSLIANNSLTLLQRINYSGATNNLIPIWNVITECIDNLNYNYVNYLYVGINTTSPHYSILSSKTILHYELINTYNFYDENGDATNLFDVLDICLKSYNLYIKMVNGNLYILDHLAEISPNFNYKKFNIQTNFNYISTEIINNNIGDLSDFIFSNSKKDIIPAVNKAKVKFSPFSNTTLLNFEADTKYQILTGETIMSTDEKGAFKYKYFNNNNTDITLQNSKLVQAEGIGTDNLGYTEDFLLIKSGGINAAPAITFNNINSYLVNYNNVNTSVNTKYYLKITLVAQARTKPTYRNKNDDNFKTLRQYTIDAKLKLGDKYYNCVNYNYAIYPPVKGVWTTSDSILTIPLFNDFRTNITTDGRKWLGNISAGDSDITSNELDYIEGTVSMIGGFFIPLFNSDGSTFNENGQLEFSIYDKYTGIREIGYQYDNFDFWDWSTNQIKDIWIKKVKIEVVDFYKKSIADVDYEKIAYFNPNYAEELQETVLKFGDSQSRISSERGALYYQKDDYIDFTTGHTREGITTSLQNLYLRSVLSNYKNSTYKLSGDIYNNIINNIGYITNNNDNNFINKKLIIAGYKHIICDNITQLILKEINNDTENIIEG